MTFEYDLAENLGVTGSIKAIEIQGDKADPQPMFRVMGIEFSCRSELSDLKASSTYASPSFILMMITAVFMLVVVGLAL
jgi:hypothetical protein